MNNKKVGISIISLAVKTRISCGVILYFAKNGKCSVKRSRLISKIH